VSFVSFVVNPSFRLVAALPRWALRVLRGESYLLMKVSENITVSPGTNEGTCANELDKQHSIR